MHSAQLVLFIPHACVYRFVLRLMQFPALLNVTAPLHEKIGQPEVDLQILCIVYTYSYYWITMHALVY